jgi:hypothetical protein
MPMASPPTTVEEFLALGQKSGLLDRHGLGTYLEQLRAARRKRDGAADALPDAPRPLAQQMVRDGLLTRFQAGQLLEGRWRGFLIAGKYRLLDCLGTGRMIPACSTASAARPEPPPSCTTPTSSTPTTSTPTAGCISW